VNEPVVRGRERSATWSKCRALNKFQGIEANRDGERGDEGRRREEEETRWNRDGMIGKEDMAEGGDEAIYLSSRRGGRLMTSGDGGSGMPGQMAGDPAADST
jgi:photosystem II stability/assembly factor-like uncharacterized protein